MTGGLTRYIGIDHARTLRDIAYSATEMFDDADWAALESYRTATAQRRAAVPNLLPARERHQAQLTVLAFKTGVAVSADLFLGGFDTHANNDPDQEWLLGSLTGAVDYLRDYAEIHGVADRMVVVIGSDFGRPGWAHKTVDEDIVRKRGTL